MLQSLLKYRFILLPLFYICPLFYHWYPLADFYDGVITGIFLFTGTILLLYGLSARHSSPVNLNYLDLFVLLFLLYALINSLFTDPAHTLKNDNILLVIAIALYFAFKQSFQSSNSFAALCIIILFTGLVTQGYGILQLIHLLPIINTQYRATGPFFNPNVFCTYLTINFPLVLYNLFYSKHRVVRILSGIFCMNVFVFDVLLSSRAALLFLLVICIVLLITLSRTKKLKYAGLAILSILFIAGSILSANIKPGSASGRILIWRISSKMFLDNPVNGTGWGMYKSHYNNYQAQYFIAGNYSKQEASLADENYESFNDLLTIAIEEGIIGIILFAGIVCAMFLKTPANSKLIYVRCAIILVIGIGFFSYTMDEPFLFIEFVTLLAVYSANSDVEKFCTIKLKYVSNVVALLIAIPCFYNYYYSNTWLNIRHSNNEANIQKYTMLYVHLKDQPDFLSDYARADIQDQNYLPAMNLLREGIAMLPSPQSYSALAIVYDRLSLHKNAEDCLIRASMISPHKFSPKLMLLEYYSHISDTVNTYKIAHEILQMDVKVPSMEIDLIRKIAGECAQGKH